MIPKPLESVTQSDIQGLVAAQARERRTMEYKRQLPGNSDAEKREFLADVTSFANAAGGDLLYGVDAIDGIPNKAYGLSGNVDAQILRMEQMIRSGVAPRVQGVRTWPVDGFPNGPVLILRIPRSWTAPHMVTFKNWSRFFTRNSAGKHEMNIDELRSAFLLWPSMAERARRFRDDRLGRIIAGQTPVPLATGAKLVLHIMAPASLDSGVWLDSSALERLHTDLAPLGALGWNHRFNLDGLVTYEGIPESPAVPSYCQLFRAGAVESVHSNMVYDRQGIPLLSGGHFEHLVIEGVTTYARALKSLEVVCPLLISVSLLDASGVWLDSQELSLGEDTAPIDRDEMVLPDVLVEDYQDIAGQDGAASVLKPIFDALWNAGGRVRSPNYDAEGRWRPR